MKRLALFSALTLAFSFLTACSKQDFGDITGTVNAPKTIVDDKFVPGLPAGYQCPLVPNGFDPAGSIYRLDRSGTYYRVKDFSKDPIVAKGHKKDVQIANYVLSDTQKSNAGLSLNLLKSALPGVTAGGNADFKKELSVDITVQDMQGDIIYDETADYIVKWFAKNIKPRRGSKYYLVRETVRAGAVSYRIAQNELAKLGGKAKLEKIADGKANVTIRDNDGSLEIKQNFSPRIPICIKSAEIVIDRPKKNKKVLTREIKLKSVDETVQPKIKKVGRS